MPGGKRKYHGVHISSRYTGRGHEIKAVEVEVTCKKCGQSFKCVMTTKPLRYCPACKEVAEAEKTERDKRRIRKLRATPRPKPERRKIPYAGYDNGEIE